MAVAWYRRFTPTFGRRWSGYLAIVLLIGMISIRGAEVPVMGMVQPSGR